GPELLAVREALQAQPRRPPVGRARRSRRAETRSPRLRALEGDEAWGARKRLLGEPVGQGPSGLAHRVLGDEPEVPWHHLRRTRGREGSRLPPPRERDCAERGGERPAARALLVAQRLHDDGLRED